MAGGQSPGPAWPARLAWRRGTQRTRAKAPGAAPGRRAACPTKPAGSHTDGVPARCTVCGPARGGTRRVWRMWRVQLGRQPARTRAACRRLLWMLCSARPQIPHAASSRHVLRRPQPSPGRCLNLIASAPAPSQCLQVRSRAPAFNVACGSPAPPAPAIRPLNTASPNTPPPVKRPVSPSSRPTSRHAPPPPSAAPSPCPT